MTTGRRFHAPPGPSRSATPARNGARGPSEWAGPGLRSGVEHLGALSWRLIGIGIVAWVALLVLDRLRVVVFPLAVATLLTVVLSPPARWLRRRGWPSLAAAWAVFAAFLGVVGLVGFLAVPPVAAEFGTLGETVGEAYDDVERWIVEESPFDIDRERMDELEAQARDALRRSLGASNGIVVRGATLVLEVVAGLLLTLVLTFFLVKDGERFQSSALRRLPPDRRDTARRLARRAWATLAGYLRGSATLGAVEAVAIGLALALSGGRLVGPVMAVTFAAAFVPFVGAIVAGIVAVAVALSTAGFTAAVVVAIVALVVQQLDGDLLAPVVFGRAVHLHPIVVLLAVTSGAALFGLAGAFLAVPVTAVTANVWEEARITGGSGDENREHGGDLNPR